MVVLILMELDWYFKEGRKFKNSCLVSSTIKREPILDICTIKQKSHKLFVGLALVLFERICEVGKMKIFRVLRQNNTYSLLKSHKMSIAVTIKQANTSCSLSSMYGSNSQSKFVIWLQSTPNYTEWSQAGQSQKIENPS